MRISTLSSWLLAVLSTHSCLSTQQNTSSNYAPIRVDCPTNVQWLRPAHGLNPQEKTWVAGRKHVVYDALSAYLHRLGLQDFDLDEYLCRLRDSDYEDVPVMALAISGGGTASAYPGAGVYQALDSRYAPAIQQRTGGLLQSMTYITGQSGGTWPTLAFPSYGFPTAAQLLQDWKPWINHATNETVVAIFKGIEQKFKAGFNISMSDFYGQLFGVEYLPNNGTTPYSSLVELPGFKNHSMPMPFFQASEVVDGDAEFYGLKVPATDGTATLYEGTPFEFGAWEGRPDLNPSGFIPTKYLGTSMYGGRPVNNQSCVEQFDQSGFMLGAAAAAVNFWQIEGESNYTLAPFSKRSASTPSAAVSREHLRREPVDERAFRRREEPIPFLQQLDSTLYQEFAQFGLEPSSVTYAPVPNPFYGVEGEPDYHRDTKDLTLVDATEVGQAIPLWGLLQPVRKTKFIVALDSDGDASPYNWNNGTNIYDAYVAARSYNLSFPKIPTVNTIMNRGYNLRPTLFGCAVNVSRDDARDLNQGPVIAYITNAPYSAYTNYSFAQTTFSETQMDEIFLNTFNIVTQGNGTWDKEWPVCLGCAAIERSRETVGVKRSRQCERCFAKYCWDGVEDNRTPGIVDPPLALDPGLSFQVWNQTNPF